MEKFFIAYHKNGRFSADTESGFFVKYKNKIQDEYSNNYLFAKRYKSIGSILNRFNYFSSNYNPKLEVILEYIEFQIKKQSDRIEKLHNVLDINKEVDINWDAIKIFKNDDDIYKIIFNGDKKPQMIRVTEEVYNHFKKTKIKYNKKIENSKKTNNKII